MMVDTFAHATGLLLLLHTGRIQMFGASAEGLMARYIEDCVVRLSAGKGARRRSGDAE